MALPARASLRAALIVSLMFIGLREIAAAESTAPADSILTSAPPDSLRIPVVPIPHPGSIARGLPPSALLDDSAMLYEDYRNIGNLLQLFPGTFIRDLGTMSQEMLFSVRGLDERSIGLTRDGVPLNDPLTGLYDLSLYPAESIERIEVITGTRSFLYGLNSTGGAVNIVTKSRKSIHPYTRIHYDQSADNYSIVDGMFSQDIFRGINLTAGLEHPGYGGRFANSGYDIWNGRFQLRDNVSNSLNVFASIFYTQTNLDLNGGVDDSSTSPAFLFDPRNAIVRNTDSYEKFTRTDVQTGIALKGIADSSSLTVVTLYHSTALREYRDEENRFNPNGIFVHEDHRSQWYGVRLSHSINLRGNPLEIGAGTEFRGTIADDRVGQQLHTLTSAYGSIELALPAGARLAPAVRIEDYLGYGRTSYGADLRFGADSTVLIWAGYSRSFRYPTVQEMSAGLDSLHFVRDGIRPESHDLFEVGLALSDRQRELRVTVFHRRITDPIDLNPDERTTPPIPTDPSGQTTMQGFTLSGTMRVSSFTVRGNVQYLSVDDRAAGRQRIPAWDGLGELYYQDKLVGGHLGLKTGIRLKGFSEYHASGFDPRTQWSAPLSPEREISPSVVTDFFLVAHLGDAYIHLDWENLSDRDYVMTYFYPMPDRAIRFGLTWEFSD